MGALPCFLMKIFLFLFALLSFFDGSAQRRQLKWANVMLPGTPNKVAGWNANGDAAEIDLPVSSVTSVFGRTGIVIAQSNDYTFAQIGSKPTTLAGYGITDPIVLTSGSYANPAWISSLSWSKITDKPTTITGYGITDLANGIYTPVVANQSGVSSLTAFENNYQQVGNSVTVSGRVSFTPDAADALCSLTITLPIASNFTDSDQCGGTAVKIINNALDTDFHGTIEANTTSDKAVIFFVSRGTSTACTMKYMFLYTIQ